MGSVWDKIENPKIIAIATDAFGYINGFSTPPQFVAAAGQWQPTKGGKKYPLYLDSTAPGDTASQKVQYRPGNGPDGKPYDPGIMNRPRPIAKPSWEDPLAEANRRALGVVKDADGVPPPVNVIGAAPGRVNAPQPAAPVAPVVAAPAAVSDDVRDFTERNIQEAPPLDVLTVTPPVTDKDKIQLTTETAQSGTVTFSPSILASTVTLPPFSSGDPVGPGPHYYPPVDPTSPGFGVGFDLAKELEKAQKDPRGLLLDPNTKLRADLVVLEARVAELETLVKNLVILATSTVGSECTEALAAIAPKPVLTHAERNAPAELRQLWERVQALEASGMTVAEASAATDTVVRFWQAVLASRDAKISRGAKP